tara:strand:- start:2205 stop:3161 length:957 start_codon:yes stop_codon:yes gene_type:complete
MSLTEKQLKELLKKIIRKELQERDIEEASVAANVPGYMTPRAFSGTGKMDRRDSVASGSGFTKVNEDKDIGHQDDEPNMLRSTTLELMEYSKKLHDALKKYDDSSEEVDFPNWWQSKLIISKEYLQKAYHYLDSEEKLSNEVQTEQINEVMFAVKVEKDGQTIQTIVNASSKSQAKARIAKILKGGLKAVKDVQRVQPTLGKQIDKKIEGFKSDAQRRAAFASGYKAKGKKKKKEGVNEGRYHQWRNDETLTPKQKIGRSMREVKNALNSLSKQIDFNVRLKNELNVDSSSYWKTTHKALNSISERLVKLANKVGKLQ